MELVETVETKEGRKRTNRAVALANAKPTREMLADKHEDPELNRQRCIQNFTRSWIGDLWNNEAEFREFIDECWEYHANKETRDIQLQIEALKSNPLAAELLKREFSPKSSRSKATADVA